MSKQAELRFKIPNILTRWLDDQSAKMGVGRATAARVHLMAQMRLLAVEEAQKLEKMNRINRGPTTDQVAAELQHHEDVESGRVAERDE